MRDIVLPHGNEKDFLSVAQKLGYDELWFVYPSKKDFYKRQSAIAVKSFVLTSRNQGQHNTAAKVTLETIRKTLEMVRPTFIYGVEESPRKDHIHQRGSGFNHILARIAHDKNIAVAFSFAQLRSTKRRSRILGRISQNITLCRKYNVRTLIGSFAKNPEEMRAPHDLASLFSLLGMHPQEVKNSLN